MPRTSHIQVLVYEVYPHMGVFPLFRRVFFFLQTHPPPPRRVGLNAADTGVADHKRSCARSGRPRRVPGGELRHSHPGQIEGGRPGHVPAPDRPHRSLRPQGRGDQPGPGRGVLGVILILWHDQPVRCVLGVILILLWHDQPQVRLGVT